MAASTLTQTALAAPRQRLLEAQRGALRALPMMLSYLPLSFAFGVLALGNGLSASNMLLMSLLVYGCSSQVKAVQLMAAGAAPLAVIATTFVINLRHTLMASSLAPHLRRFSLLQLMGFSYSLSDEAFALHSTRMERGRPSVWECFGVNISLHVSWMVGSLMALLVPSDTAFLQRYGLDFAPAAMFIALLMLMVKNLRQLLVAGFGGLLAVALQCFGVGSFGVIIATGLGASLGLWSERWTSDKS